MQFQAINFLFTYLDLFELCKYLKQQKWQTKDETQNAVPKTQTIDISGVLLHNMSWTDTATCVY